MVVGNVSEHQAQVPRPLPVARSASGAPWCALSGTGGRYMRISSLVLGFSIDRLAGQHGVDRSMRIEKAAEKLPPGSTTS